MVVVVAPTNQPTLTPTHPHTHSPQPQGEEGISRLFDLLRNRYGQTLEGRRQIAILFSFLEKDQPVERIARLLSDTDNASVAAFRLITGCVHALARRSHRPMSLTHPSTRHTAATATPPRRPRA